MFALVTGLRVYSERSGVVPDYASLRDQIAPNNSISHTFAGLEGLLDAPPLPGDAHQGAQWDRVRTVGQVVGQLVGGIVAAHQHPPMPGLGWDRQARPGVHPQAVRADPGGQSLLGLMADLGRKNCWSKG